MKRIIEKLEDFIESNFEKVVLDKEEVKTIIEYYNSKGE